MPAISNFIKAQKSKYIQAKKWRPVFYYVDANDKHLCHPDIELLQLAEKACKYLYRGATFDSTAIWLNTFAAEMVEKRKAKDPEYNLDMQHTLSKDGMKVFYRKWLKVRGAVALSSRLKTEKKTKKEVDERFGDTVEAVGFDTVAHSQDEKTEVRA